MADPALPASLKEYEDSLKEAMLYGRHQERDEIAAWLAAVAATMDKQAKTLGWSRIFQKACLMASVEAIRVARKQVLKRHRQKSV